MALPIIHDLRNIIPEDHPYYFFDSNVWIAILAQTGGQKVKSHEQDYIDFWEAIVHIHSRKGVPSLEKRTKNFPKIVLPAIVLTEVINAHLRIASELYLKTNPPVLKPFQSKPTFKENYRPTPHYQQKLRQILSDIQSLSDYLELKDDGFSSLGIIDQDFSNFNPDFDFNDYFFAKLFKNTGIPIVTHDKDYAMFEGITIFTLNEKLLKI